MTKKILVRFLAMVGAVSILGLSGYLVRGYLAADAFLPGRPLPSPNGKYKAVLFIDAGGPPGGSHCYTKILIIPNTLDEKQAGRIPNRWRTDEGKYDVFSGPCDSFKDHSSSPKLNWITDNSLEIGLSINSTALFAHDLRLGK